MRAQDQDISAKIKTLKLIHFALCAGVTMAYVFAGDLIDRLTNVTIESSQFIYLGIPIAAIVLSNVMYKKQLQTIDPKQSDEQNLAIYQTANIIRWAILEAGAFIFLIAFPEHLLFGVPLIFYMISLIPGEEKFRDEVQKSFGF